MARRKQESLDINDTGSSAGEVTDAQLLQRHLQGDSAAFGALIERYRQELYAFLARFVGDRHLAEDVFQEAFLQLHISAGSFDLTRRLKPWCSPTRNVRSGPAPGSTGSIRCTDG